MFQWSTNTEGAVHARGDQNLVRPFLQLHIIAKYNIRNILFKKEDTFYLVIHMEM